MIFSAEALSVGDFAEMELLAPWGLAGLASLAAIVATYFLRRRKTPRVVGSLMLWQEARQDVFRGRPWERFVASVLLWPQLLAALALGLALARPACVTTSTEARSIVLLLDASASMAATDVEPSRYDGVLDRAAELVETSPSGSRFAVVVAGRTTRIVAPFTTDRGLVQRRLDELRARGPDHVRGSLREALLLSVQLGAGSSTDIVVFSDGAFPHDELPGLPAQVQLVTVGGADDNLAITAFELRRRPGQHFGTTSWCRVENKGSAPMRGHLRFELDGELVEAHSVELDPGESGSWSVPFDTERGRIVARLVDARADAGRPDVMPLDDVAYAVVSPQRPVRVLSVGANALLLRALEVHPQIDHTAITPDLYTDASSYDITIFEGFFPGSLPQGRFIAIDPPAGSPLLDYSGEVLPSTRVASWDRGHPVLYHVELADVRFESVERARPHDALVPIAEFSGNDGPFLLVGGTPTWRAVVLTVDVLDSDLPLRVAFPLLLYNAVGWLNRGGHEATGHTVAAGQPLRFPAPAGTRFELVAPDGTSTDFVTDRRSDGHASYDQTHRIGFYQVTTPSRQPGGEVEVLDYGVSLSSSVESNITPRDRLELPRGVELVGQQSVEHVRELETELALAAGAFILLELVLLLVWVMPRRRRLAGASPSHRGDQ